MNPAPLSPDPSVTAASATGPGLLLPPDQERWFAAEVHAHDSALKSYLRRTFPSLRDLEDVVQESYLRIWRARTARPIASAKTFLFQIARHLIVDGVRHTQVAKTESLGDLAELPVLEDKPDARETLAYREKVRLLAEALAALPTRCRAIMILRKLEDLSHREIAARLGISERTVESQVTRGMKLIATQLRARGVQGFSCDEG